jgi:Protein of unknown function (DUF3604).
MEGGRGYNPYKMGVVGASDSHNTASGYVQSDYFGGHGLMDATDKIRISGKKELGMDVAQLSTSGWEACGPKKTRVLRSLMP